MLPDIDIRWTAHSLLKSDAHVMRLAVPVLQLAAWVGATARDRIADKGRPAHGRFTPYSKGRAQARREQGLPTNGRHFSDTGGLFEGLRARLGAPNRARVSFVGKARRKGVRSNARLARFLARWERQPLLSLSPDEERELDRLAGSLFSAELVEALNIEAVGFRAAQRARGLERRAKKAMRELTRGRGVS